MPKILRAILIALTRLEMSFFRVNKKTTYKEFSNHSLSISVEDETVQKVKRSSKKTRLYKKRKFKKRKQSNFLINKRFNSKPKDRRFSNQNLLRRMYRST